MAIRIEWDEFEIALLIEACEEVLRKGKPKSEVVKTVSSKLRKRAISKNIAIDDVFRNENGIALQMQKMAYLLTHGEKGMPGASKLYADGYRQVPLSAVFGEHFYKCPKHHV